MLTRDADNIIDRSAEADFAAADQRLEAWLAEDRRTRRTITAVIIPAMSRR